MDNIWFQSALWMALFTAVIGSAVVPTLIAQIWFQPHFEPLEEDA
jgi:hypothetical protein